MYLAYDNNGLQDFRFTVIDTNTNRAIKLQPHANARHVYHECTEFCGTHHGKLIDFFDLAPEFQKFFFEMFHIKYVEVAKPYRNLLTLDLRNFSYSRCLNLNGRPKKYLLFEGELTNWQK